MLKFVIRSEEEKLKLKATIAELEEELERKKERHQLLAGQIRKIETDLNLSRRKLEEVRAAQHSRRPGLTAKAGNESHHYLPCDRTRAWGAVQAKETSIRLTAQIAGLQQDNSGAAQQLARVEKDRNQAMVENDLLRVEVKRLRQHLLGEMTSRQMCALHERWLTFRGTRGCSSDG